MRVHYLQKSELEVEFVNRALQLIVASQNRAAVNDHPRAGMHRVCRNSTINRLFVGNSGIRRGVEQVACVHPGLGLFKHRSCIGLRDDTFADPETANVDLVAKALGNLVDEVVLELLWLHIDIGLCPDQGTHIPLDVS